MEPKWGEKCILEPRNRAVIIILILEEWGRAIIMRGAGVEFVGGVPYHT